VEGLLPEVPQGPAVPPVVPLAPRLEVAPAASVALPRPRTAIVLAAGSSERLRSVTGGGSKLLLRVGGLTVIERTVRLAAREVERVVVVVGHDGQRVAAAARRAAPGRVEVIQAERWQLGNGASLAAAEPVVAEEPLVLVVVGDHLLGEGTLGPLLDAGGPAALVDPEPAAYVLEEATRVVVADGRALAFGKDKHSSWCDCGAFVLPAEVFECQREAAAAQDGGLAGAVSRLALACPIAAVPVLPPGWWQDLDDPRDLREARARLRRSLTKPGDGPVSRYLNRPLSTRLSVALAPLRPSPDLVTLLVCGLGLLTGGLLAAGHHLVGGLLAQATSVLDGVDGELARLQLRNGPRGAMLDGVLDRWADTAIAAGLGLWTISRGLTPAVALVLTAAAVAASLLSMSTKDRAAALCLPRAPEGRLAWLLGGRDGRLLLVAVFALLGQPAAALAAVTLTAGLTAVARLYLVRRET
jgi:1L-myo-inositol 1-phosphate cytidylyltransferase / CDP-L-myo-inositol myo-inositolphosphotransferase